MPKKTSLYRAVKRIMVSDWAISTFLYAIAWSITSWKAIELYQATRLADIIFTLKQQGWNIIKALQQHPGDLEKALRAA